MKQKDLYKNYPTSIWKENTNIPKIEMRPKAGFQSAQRDPPEVGLSTRKRHESNAGLSQTARRWAIR